jgi:arsenate reductase (glutaredoxin)
MPKTRMKIYHNNRCSKSRCALDFIEEHAADPEIVNYLEQPPTEDELKKLIVLLGIKAEELIRKKEPIFVEKYGNKKLTEVQCIRAMLKYPVLIERPIVVIGKRAIIARTQEALDEIFKT